ncbi:FeoA family protein [Desulfonauticus submarinus]|nr:FeoA family protein [Desulfonauticus submarinus]
MSPKPLSKFPPGTKVKIVSFCGGCRLRGRMCALGIFPGVEIEVSRSCPLQIKVKDSTLLLGKGAGEKILGIPIEE